MKHFMQFGFSSQSVKFVTCLFSQLPLPYLRAGWLRIPPTGDSLAPHSDWLRLWFVLDHEALYEVSN